MIRCTKTHGIVGGSANEALERRWHYLIGGIYAAVTLLYIGATFWHFWGARQHPKDHGR